MDQLEQIKQKIDSILEKRKESRAKLAVTVEKICELEIVTKKAIDDLAKLDHEKRDYYLSELNKVLGQIRAIKQTSAPLQKRFNRDTVNLGVAGATQAGKSTLLQAISGLSENELPTAQDGDPTTAARSILINNPTNVATVKFRTKSELVDFVNGFLPKTSKNVSDVSDISRLNISSMYCDDAEINDNLARLDEIQKILTCHDFEGLYGTNKDIPFDQITNYVSYCKGKNVEQCFWPVVKIVEIKCNFNALNKGDIKLSLVDLPGMGERDEVDSQMVNGLEEEVDNVMLLFKTTAVQPQRDLKTFNAIKNAQKDIKDKTKFLSFFINVVQIDNKDIQAGQIQSIENRISSNFKRIAGDFTIYKTDAFNDKEKVSLDLIDVLQRLADNLFELDGDLLSAWESSLNFDTIKQSLVYFSNQIKSDLPISSSEHTLLNNKKAGLLKRLSYFNDLEEQYEIPNTIDKIRQRVNAFVLSISDQIEKEPLNNENWDSDYEDKSRQAKGKTGLVTDEIPRLWTYIRNQYSALEKCADEFLVELKNDVIVKFNELIGKDGFVSATADEGISQLLDKVTSTGRSMPFLENAFASLLTEKISFNQIAYQYIVNSELRKVMSTDKRRGGKVDVNSFLANEGASWDEEKQQIKQKLINKVLEVNGEMVSIICENSPKVIASFLFAKMEFFNDCLNRFTFKDEELNEAWDPFCESFCVELWPDVFGNSEQALAVKNLTSDLNNIITVINNLKK